MDLALQMPAGSDSTPGPVAPAALVFVRDADSEDVLRQCMSDLGAVDVEFSNHTAGAAAADLARRGSPRLLVVDISEDEEPVARIRELAEVCEPTTGVVVIGTTNDIRLYRDLKDVGVVEYFFKPLVTKLVTHTCGTILSGGNEERSSRVGKLALVVGVRGGCGATTVATTAAWQLAETGRRRVVLVDLDLLAGDAALQLDVPPSHALIEALLHPDRVDDLFLKRGIVEVTQRLGLLASLQAVGESAPLDEAAVLALLANLLRRYRYVVVDLPPEAAAKLPRVLHLPGTCLLVSNGSLAAARDVARWCEAIGPNSGERTTLHVLNHKSSEGNLPLEEFTRAAGRAPDIVINYDRSIAAASVFGIRRLQESVSFQRTIAAMLTHLSGERPPPPKSLLSRLLRR